MWTKANGEVSPTPQNFAKLPCVYAEMGGEDGGEKVLGKTRKADTKNPRKKQTKERKTNKKTFNLKVSVKMLKGNFLSLVIF